MNVVITNSSGYEIPEKCFNIPVRAMRTRNPHVVYIPREELMRIGAFSSGEWLPEMGLSFLIGFEVRRVD